MTLKTEFRQLFLTLYADLISSLFQCQPSSDESGQVYTPNIPDFYFNDENTADFRTGDEENLITLRNRLTYIFTKSSERNCTGNVVAIQYCYETRNSQIGSNEILSTHEQEWIFLHSHW